MSAHQIRQMFVVAVIALVMLIPPLAAAQRRAQPSYFSRARDVQVTPNRQNYFLVDEAIWTHARSDLGDIRLYRGHTEVPYALIVRRGSSPGQQRPARLLNLGRVKGETQFVLDMSAAPEYDAVELRLADTATDFVVTARVEGLEELSQPGGVALGTSTLFDFSREKLGRNFTIRLAQPAAFRFLRVQLPQLAPEQVLGASYADTRCVPADWTLISAPSRISQQGRDTVIFWEGAGKVPVARVVFDVDPAQANFLRTVELQGMDGDTLHNGELSRIHLARGSDRADREQLAITFPQERLHPFKAIIHNGDDPPLKITAARAYAFERRVYFDPGTEAAGIQLYVGDPQLAAPPVYDYAKLFRAEADAAVATLGPDSPNPAYTGRPDERPWTDRHPVVLWTALLLAVLGLGAVALRGLKPAGSKTP